MRGNFVFLELDTKIFELYKEKLKFIMCIYLHINRI